VYTITIKDLVTQNVTDICTAPDADSAEQVMLALVETLPHYLEVDFYEEEVA
jgi:hypothetical protein